MVDLGLDNFSDRSTDRLTFSCQVESFMSSFDLVWISRTLLLWWLILPLKKILQPQQNFWSMKITRGVDDDRAGQTAMSCFRCTLPWRNWFQSTSQYHPFRLPLLFKSSFNNSGTRVDAISQFLSNLHLQNAIFCTQKNHHYKVTKALCSSSSLAGRAWRLLLHRKSPQFFPQLIS